MHVMPSDYENGSTDDAHLHASILFQRSVALGMDHFQCSKVWVAQSTTNKYVIIVHLSCLVTNKISKVM